MRKGKGGGAKILFSSDVIFSYRPEPKRKGLETHNRGSESRKGFRVSSCKAVKGGWGFYKCGDGGGKSKKKKKKRVRIKERD